MRRATNCGYAYVVAPGELKERSALRAASGGFTAKRDSLERRQNLTPARWWNQGYGAPVL
jgi:hypothetical protein